ncbi:MAG: hypothetical protein DHS20C18_32750 [Saprospiraceae bacterium]|nr:MAG: hypothetical protein DHS20C18_32750 [Saprospiraceae bacterium]
MWYLIAPLLFFYAKLFIQNNYAFRWYDALHFLPFLGMAIYYWPLVIADAHIKMDILENYKATSDYGLITNLSILMMMLQMLTYITISFYRLKQYESNYKSEFSENQIVHLVWLKNIFRFFLFYFLFEFTFSTLRNFFGFRSTFLDNWSLVVWVIYIYTIAYLILTQAQYIFPKFAAQKLLPADKNQEKDYEDVKNLKTYMQRQKPYLKSDLKLPELAKALGFSTNYLSFIINTHLGVNFYEFINRYRAVEAKNMLVNDDFANFTISGIASEAGFKSKTSFYKFFKKEFKMTPKEYLAKQDNLN